MATRPAPDRDPVSRNELPLNQMPNHRTPNRRRLLRWLGGWLGFTGLSPALAAGDGAAKQDAPPQPLEVPLAAIAPGELVEVQWQGRPVFIRRRTADEIARERAVPLAGLRDPERDRARVKRAEWVVVEGICTHGGCVPNGPLGDFGGWYCLCHGSQFDTAGRVRAGPARENLRVPPYEFVGRDRLRIGTPATTL